MKEQMTPDQKRKIVTTALAVGVVMALIGLLIFPDNTLLLFATSAVFILTIVLQVKFYRCPYCGRYIGRHFYGAANCPRCNRLINPELQKKKPESQKNNGHKQKKKKK